jgi:2-hydroxychromene-2-carboxylate isomerase
VRFLRERGNSPFDAAPLRGQYRPDYRHQDAQRWAALYKVPFHEPRGRLTLDSELLALTATAGLLLGKGPELSRALFAAVFGGEASVLEAAECRHLATSVGIPQSDFDACLNAEALAALEATMQRAHALGVFGVPTFIVDGQQFWGNDRLPLLEYYLRRTP